MIHGDLILLRLTWVMVLILGVIGVRLLIHWVHFRIHVKLLLILITHLRGLLSWHHRLTWWIILFGFGAEIKLRLLILRRLLILIIRDHWLFKIFFLGDIHFMILSNQLWTSWFFLFLDGLVKIINFLLTYNFLSIFFLNFIHLGD